MSRQAIGCEIEGLIRLLSRLPGLGPRSARRAALYLVENRATVLAPLATVMAQTRERVVTCSICGNIDTVDPCAICTDCERDDTMICVVEEVGDLWALERAGVIKSRYHVLGGVLSAIDGIGPGQLNITGLVSRVAGSEVGEIVLAVNATVEGQITAHYITECLKDFDVAISRLAHGVPVGGELDYLDEGTLSAAFKARRPY